MRRLLLVFISVVAIESAWADEKKPVNFHADRKVGQYNANLKISDETEATTYKICFVTGGLFDEKTQGNFEPGCSGKKIKDTSTELDYEVVCEGRPQLNMSWRRLSKLILHLALKLGI